MPFAVIVLCPSLSYSINKSLFKAQVSIHSFKFYFRQHKQKGKKKNGKNDKYTKNNTHKMISPGRIITIITKVSRHIQ